MACVSCGGKLHRHRRYDFKTAVFRRVYTDPYVYRCAGCGLRQAVTTRIDSEALTQYYQHDYRGVAKIGTDTSAGTSPYYRARAAAIAALVPANAAPRTVFELGSGYGYNLRAMAERFPGVTLATDELDLSAAARLGASKRVLDDGPYDVIILSHVVEHFTDPVSLVRRARESLAPGGHLIIEVPNDVENIYTINGPDEPHLTFFTLDTFRLLLRKAGVRCADVFAAGPDYRRKTPLNRFQRDVQAASHRLRLLRPLRALLNWRSRRLLSNRALTTRNPQGNVLRAVIQRGQPES